MRSPWHQLKAFVVGRLRQIETATNYTTDAAMRFYTACLPAGWRGNEPLCFRYIKTTPFNPTIPQGKNFPFKKIVPITIACSERELRD